MILVFKTNVTDNVEAQKLQPLLDEQLRDFKWSFDLNDCDKILRVDAQLEVSATVIEILKFNGYECEELLD